MSILGEITTKLGVRPQMKVCNRGPDVDHIEEQLKELKKEDIIQVQVRFRNVAKAEGGLRIYLELRFKFDFEKALEFLAADESLREHFEEEEHRKQKGENIGDMEEQKDEKDQKHQDQKSHTPHNSETTEKRRESHGEEKKHDDSKERRRFNRRKCERAFRREKPLFPYNIFSKTDEDFIKSVVKVRKHKDGIYVEERIHTIITTPYIEYLRYYPFTLKMMQLTIGMDGSIRDNHVYVLIFDDKNPVDIKVLKENISYDIPRVPKETNLRYGLTPIENGYDKFNNGISVFIRFEAPVMENLFKFIGISTFLLHFTVFLPDLEFQGAIETTLVIVL
eukprot:CAMPEP_0170181568 /NCGR_PEP_ID=MMETSP0040_2-20121228/25455_1 /TAXON_ID=641309 /ORGANISM="Lotharella oceanica, Strain CCMP622" /LENGTH=334 /DNA_ID=CAMNT_0010426675 /DNA_START=625 /DNA_END=1625 /DNA_ORIENTATION=-